MSRWDEVAFALRETFKRLKIDGLAEQEQMVKLLLVLLISWLLVGQCLITINSNEQ